MKTPRGVDNRKKGGDSLSQPEGGFWLEERSENQTVLFIKLKKKHEDSVKEM